MEKIRKNLSKPERRSLLVEQKTWIKERNRLEKSYVAQGYEYQDACVLVLYDRIDELMTAYLPSAALLPRPAVSKDNQPEPKSQATKRKEVQRPLNAPTTASTYTADLMISAAKDANLELVRQCLLNGVDANGKGKENYSTALSHAVKNNDIPMITLLMDKGATANKGSCWESELVTPEKDILELLLSKGTDPNTCRGHGPTPTLLAAVTQGEEKDLLERTKLLLKHGAKLEGAVVGAASKNRFALAKFLIENGADVNDLVESGGSDGASYNALLYAIEHKNHIFVDFLLSHGANIELTDSLHHAVYQNNLRLVKKLVEAGADVNHINYGENYTPLQSAKSVNNRSIVKYLSSKKAKENQFPLSNEIMKQLYWLLDDYKKVEHTAINYENLNRSLNEGVKHAVIDQWLGCDKVGDKILTKFSAITPDRNLIVVIREGYYPQHTRGVISYNELAQFVDHDITIDGKMNVVVKSYFDSPLPEQIKLLNTYRKELDDFFRKADELYTWIPSVIKQKTMIRDLRTQKNIQKVLDISNCVIR